MVQRGIICLILFLAFANTFGQTNLKGAGASFPAPLYESWIEQYSQSNPKINISYQSVGSGLGVKMLLRDSIDFGASDIPMSDSNLKKSAFKIIHIPSVVGAIAIIYNHPQIPNSLKIDASTLSKIFQSKVKYWDDPLIKELNPGIKLPGDAIQPIVREDHSGTSKILRKYLRRYGFGKSNWRATFVRAKGSKGVSNLVQQTESSIGYINLSFARSNSHKVMSIRNSNDEFIQPSPKALSIAASKVRGSRVRVSLLDQEIAGAYPLASFSFFLIPLKKNATQKELKRFLTWSLSYGQRVAPKFHYAPLPKKLAKTLIERL